MKSLFALLGHLSLPNKQRGGFLDDYMPSSPGNHCSYTLRQMRFSCKTDVVKELRHRRALQNWAERMQAYANARADVTGTNRISFSDAYQNQVLRGLPVIILVNPNSFVFLADHAPMLGLIEAYGFSMVEVQQPPFLKRPSLDFQQGRMTDPYLTRTMQKSLVLSVNSQLVVCGTGLNIMTPKRPSHSSGNT